MGLLTEYTLLDFTLIITIVSVFLLNYIVKMYTFWDKLDVYSLPASFPFGNAKSLVLGKKSSIKFWKEIYMKIKKENVKYGGAYLFLRPIFIPIHPDLVKDIMIKDFEYFHGRGGFIDEENEPLTANLINLSGEKWKTLRSKLTPTFSPFKLKQMFPILLKISYELENIVELFSSKEVDIDIKNILARYTTDVIGNCAFGIECNSLKEPNTPFYCVSSKFFERNFKQNIKVRFARSFPNLFKFLRIRYMDKEVADFFTEVVRDVIDLRREDKNRKSRNDFMDMLIHLMETNKELSFNEIAAQAFVFFMAGFETSATALTFCLFELALNNEHQEEVREEINSVLGQDEDMTFEALNQMVYMDMVIKETLRKYPPFPFTLRISNKEYQLPESNKKLPKGTPVLFPLYAYQHDEEYFPNPEKFDPRRFDLEQKNKRYPYTYIPFGEGPRICIGISFAMMQIKVGLTRLLKKYRFNLSEKTNFPICFDPKNVTLTVEGKLWLRAQKI